MSGTNLKIQGAPAGIMTYYVPYQIAKIRNRNANKPQSLRYWEMFRRFCPKWHRWIMEDGFEGAYRNHIRSIESCTACIVGELYGGGATDDSDFTLPNGRKCRICENFAYDILMDYDGAN